MKVLHIEDRFHPNMGYQINFFARYHNPEYQFLILTSESSRIWTISGGKENLKSADESFSRDYNVEIIRLSSWLDRRSKNNLWLKGLTHAIREIDPDILYVHAIESYSSLRVLLNRKLLATYRVFFDTHTLLNQFRPGIRFRLYQWFLKRVVKRRIDKYGVKVFGTVPENQMILEKTYGIDRSRILYSPIGTDFSLFRYHPVSGEKLRQEYGLKKEDMVLLYTGKKNSTKNPHLVLEAIILIERSIIQPLYLFFVGPADEDYMKRFSGYEFSNNNIHLKEIPAVPADSLYKWYSMANFAVFPCENTLSALDAQACRLPVIMESDLTNRERLKKGGLTYEKGNTGDLAEKILQMINNPELVISMGKAGESFVRSRYDYKQIVKEMEADLGIFEN